MMTRRAERLLLAGTAAIFATIGLVSVDAATTGVSSGIALRCATATDRPVLDGDGLIQCEAPPTTTSTTTLPPTTTTTVPPTTTTTVPGPVWADEFNGTTIDAAKWNVLENSTYGDGNGEEQTYYRRNATVANGVLSMTARMEGTTPTSAFLTTRAQGGALRFKFTHGTFEARIRMPSGAAFWPSFWAVSPSDGTTPGWPAYGEFDVIEAYPTTTGVCCGESNFWWSENGTTTKLGARPHQVTGGVTGWHTYGMRWTPTTLTWLYDGVPVRTFTATTAGQKAALSYAHSLNLTLAIGGSGPEYHGYRPGTAAQYLPGVMQVDWVRVTA